MVGTVGLSEAKSDRQVDRAITGLRQTVERALEIAKELPQLLKDPVKNKGKIDEIKNQLRAILRSVIYDISFSIQRLNEQNDRLGTHIDERDLKELVAITADLSKLSERAGIDVTSAGAAGAGRSVSEKLADYSAYFSSLEYVWKTDYLSKGVAMDYILWSTSTPKIFDEFKNGKLNGRWDSLVQTAKSAWRVGESDLTCAVFLWREIGNDGYYGKETFVVYNKKLNLVMFSDIMGTHEMRYDDYLKRCKPFGVIERTKDGQGLSAKPLDPGAPGEERGYKAMERFGNALASDNPEVCTRAFRAYGGALLGGPTSVGMAPSYVKANGFEVPSGGQMLKSMLKEIKENPQSLIPFWDAFKLAGMTIGAYGAYLVGGDDTVGYTWKGNDMTIGSGAQAVGNMGLAIGYGLFDYFTLGAGKAGAKAAEMGLKELVASFKYSIKLMGEKTFGELAEMGLKVDFKVLAKAFGEKIAAKELEGMTLKEVFERLGSEGMEKFVGMMCEQIEKSGANRLEKIVLRRALVSELRTTLGEAAVPPRLVTEIMLGLAA